MRKKTLAVLLIALMVLTLVPIALAGSINIQATVNKASYRPGDTITLSGTVTSDGQPYAGAEATMLFLDPSDNPIGVGQKTTDDNGGFSLDANLPNDAANGSYKVKVACGGVVVESSFTVQGGSSSGGTTPGGSSGGSDPGGYTPVNTPTQDDGVLGEKSIGSAGGDLALPDGSMVLSITPGSVSGQATFKISKFVGSAAPPAGCTLLSDLYDISASANLSKEIGIRLKYDAARLGTVSEDRVGVYRLNGKSWQRLGGSVDPLNRVITAKTSSLGTVAAILDPSYQPPSSVSPSIPSNSGNSESLKDINDSWAKANIIKLVQKGVIKGYSDGTFRPQARVNRAEFAVMICAAMGLKPEGANSLSFNDRDRIPVWARGYVAVAVSRGILSGYSDGKFKPSQSITRAEMASMLSRALGQSSSTNTAVVFKDKDQIPPWALTGVTVAVQRGIIGGRPNGTFGPSMPATRAETATMLVKFMDQL